MKSKAALIIIFFFCAAFTFSHTQEKKLSLTAVGIDVLEIDCGAGTLDIQGGAALDEIEVMAEIVLKGASEARAKEFIQKQVELSLVQRGNRAVLISKFESHSIISVGGKAINLTVRIPENMDIDIEDGSGGMDIENIAGNIKIDDGSGEIRVLGIDGDLAVDDGSGGIKVTDITGNVEIDDGSGSIHVRNIGGNVTLKDGSGSIEVDEVTGDVYLKDDGSGGVNISNVKGRVVK